MAKVTGPLFSFSARGKLDKSIVYGSWKGISYVRKYATPANPSTPDQQAHRAVFTSAVAAWKLVPADQKILWNKAASGKPLTGFNLFTRSYFETDGNPVLP